LLYSIILMGQHRDNMKRDSKIPIILNLLSPFSSTIHGGFTSLATRSPLCVRLQWCISSLCIFCFVCLISLWLNCYFFFWNLIYSLFFKWYKFIDAVLCFFNSDFSILFSFLIFYVVLCCYYCVVSLLEKNV